MLSRTLALTLFATSIFAAEPEKITKLRGSYESAMSKATAPIQKTYVAELEKLKIEFTRAGNLEGALAVDAEIKSLEKKPTETPNTEIGTVDQSDLGWLVGMSITHGDYVWSFEADQKVLKSFQSKPGARYPYTVEPDGRIKVLSDRFQMKSKTRAILFNSVDDKKGTEVSIRKAK